MDDRRKRIRIRAWRRGFREIDLILGRFADSELEALDESEVAAFEAVLDTPDQDVYEWIVGRARAPADLADLIARIQRVCVPLPRSE